MYGMYHTKTHTQNSDIKNNFIENISGGWQNNSGQYRGPYPPQQGGSQQWNSNQRPPGPGGPSGPPPGPPGQWDQHRYPPQPQQQQPGQPPQQAQQGPPQSGPYPNQGGPQQQQQQQIQTQQQQQQQQQPWGPQGPGPVSSPLRPQQRGGKPFSMMPPQQSGKPHQFQQQSTGATPKRDITFPSDSVEATTPVLYRRKRLGKNDVSPVDPWKIFMSLRSGLLAESTWALDVLNILLFDDVAIQYFGLIHLPGLLNLLLDHFQKSLADMFDEHDGDDTENCWSIGLDDRKVDLGQVNELPNIDDRLLVLATTNNYTLSSRKGLPVKINQTEDDIFVVDTIRDWDYESNKKHHLMTTVGNDPWTYGHELPNPHHYIMDCFKAETLNIPFARYVKNLNKNTKNNFNKNDGDNNFCVSINNNNNFNKRTKLKHEESDDENNCILSEKVVVVVKNEQNDLLTDSDLTHIDMDVDKTIQNGPKLLNNFDRDIDGGGDDDDFNTNLNFNIKNSVNDPASTLKRRRITDYEDECYTRDEASLYLVTESQDSLARRCVCLSNILRNLTFVPGNETEFVKSSTFLSILGKLLLLNHEHPIRTQKTRNYDREEDADFADSCSSLQGENEWWWDYLIQIRENMLVVAANIAGHVELSRYDEMITRPILDGLLHWAVCPSAHGQDPFPTCGPHSALSPQRLALEALCKLCVTDANVDLVIATPPFSRLEKLCAVLTRHLCRNEDQVLREFSVNLLHYLAAADSAMSRTVAMQSPCISYLVAFIEQAEQTALGVANQNGINFLRENPDSMGTSLDMLRRAAGTLLHLAKHPDNRPLFMQQEQRLLGLVMSHILDQQVALIISRVLFQVSRGSGPVITAELRATRTRSIGAGGVQIKSSS